MGIRRVGTTASVPGILDLHGYEFDPGLKGIAQRIYISGKHAAKRLVLATVSFFTSFLGLHYIYVTSWALVLSWILYPMHNMSYTDALFQAVSSVSQTGLNTVNINELKVYQQVCIFVAPLFTHPLTVATAMVYYRLYLYRKEFQGIAQKAKRQSKLRRAATMSQHDAYKKGLYGRNDSPPRPLSETLQLGDGPSAQRYQPEIGYPDDGSHPSSDDEHAIVTDSDEQESVHRYKTSDGRSSSSSEVDGSRGGSSTSSPGSSSSNGRSGHDPKHSDSNASGERDWGKTSHGREEGAAISGASRNRPDSQEDSESNDNEQNDPSRIKFGDLPRPPSRDRDRPPKVDPSEMYRSLHMMHSQDLDDEMDEDDGPALVIKSPRDIEEDERRGIHSAVFEPNDPSRLHGYQHYTEGSGSHLPRRRMSTGSLYDSNGLPRSFTRADTLRSIASSRHPTSMMANYLSWTPTVGHNSAFVGLTQDQKEELGGIEYRALLALRWFLLAYYITIIGMGFVFLIPWSFEKKKYNEIIRSNGISPLTFSMTSVLSAFNNSGFCAMSDSFASFWHTAYVPIVITSIVMSGNVAIPILLRLFVYLVFKLSPPFGQTRETLGFLLDHPRRSFMLLFPAVTTWWLFLTLLVFIIVEVALFMILNSGDHSPHPDMSAGPRLLSAYFQSVITRTTGFTIINVAEQHPGMLVLNIIMMYVAIYPVAMSIRKSNVYEDQALGRYYPAPSMRSTFDSNNSRDASTAKEADVGDDGIVDDEDNDTPSTLVDHLRRQLSMDVWSLIVGLMLTAITEGGSITHGKFDLFSVIYEVASAHGTVGLSMGYGTLALSGAFSNLGKLIMMAIMIRSRHRAMPYNVDRAIILKGAEVRSRDDEQENRIRDARIMTHREPSAQQGTWLPRSATTALRSVGSIRRRPSMTRQGSDSDLPEDDV